MLHVLLSSGVLDRGSLVVDDDVAATGYVLPTFRVALKRIPTHLCLAKNTPGRKCPDNLRFRLRRSEVCRGLSVSAWTGEISRGVGEDLGWLWRASSCLLPPEEYISFERVVAVDGCALI